MLFLGLIYAWSIFREPFNRAFPAWSVADMSMAFTLSMVFFCAGCISCGRLAYRLSYNKILLIVGGLLLVGFLMTAQIEHISPQSALIWLYIFYSFFCGFGIGMGYVAVISAVVKWFPDRVGFCTGFLLMVYAFGGLVLGGGATALISELGLFNTFRFIAPITALVLVIGALAIKAPAAPTPVKPGARVLSNPIDVPPKQMLKTPQFWIFVTWNLVVCAGGLMVINLAAPIAGAFGAPEVLGLLVLIANGIGRIAFGSATDWFGRSKTMYVNSGFLLLAGLSLYAGALTHSPLLIMSGLLFVGISYGGSPALMTTVARLFFGEKHYSENFSISTLQVIPAALAGPLISSALFQASGTYNSTFIMLTALGVTAVVLNAALNKAHKA